MLQIGVDEALGGLGEGFREAEDLEAFFDELCEKALHDEESIDSIDRRRGPRRNNWRDHLRGYHSDWDELSRDKKRYLIAQAYLLQQANCPYDQSGPVLD